MRDFIWKNPANKFFSAQGNRLHRLLAGNSGLIYL